MTTKTKPATIHMDKDHHDAMVKLQTWLNAMPDWFELSEHQYDNVSEVEQDAIEASSCTKRLREDAFHGFDLNDDGALVAVFYTDGVETQVVVLPR
jgi:hypothetical protein